MTLVDILLLIISIGFAIFGLWFGLIHTLGSLAGTLAGAYLAGKYYMVIASWFVGTIGWTKSTANVLSFILLFIVINRLVGFLFWLAEKSFDVVAKLPFLNSLNKILGGVLGAVEGALTVGLIIHMMFQFSFPYFLQYLQDSSVAAVTRNLAQVLIVFLPEALQTLYY